MSIPKKILLELAAGTGGFIIGWIYAMVYPGDDRMAWVVGMLGFIVCELMFKTIPLNDAISGIRTELGALNTRIESLHDPDEHALFTMALKYAGRDLNRLETEEAWKQISFRTRKNYCATNYIDMEEFYTKGIEDGMIALQLAKSRAEKLHTRKVFLFQSEREAWKEYNVAAMKAHLGCDDLRIRYCIREDVVKGNTDDDLLKGIDGEENIDFAVFDDSVVLVWHLDEQRKVEGGRVILGKTPAKNFTAFFRSLYDRSKPIKA